MGGIFVDVEADYQHGSLPRHPLVQCLLTPGQFANQPVAGAANRQPRAIVMKPGNLRLGIAVGNDLHTASRESPYLQYLRHAPQ